MKNFLDVLAAKISFYGEVLMSFILEDFAFVVLPLGIIVFIRFLRGVTLQNILLLPEWTFATVIIFGLAIVRATKFKSTLRKKMFSGIDFLIKTFMFLLIIAVIFLVIIVLNQEGVKTNESLLITIQLTLFFLGTLSLHAIHFIQKLNEFEREMLPAQIGLWKYYEVVREGLLNVRNNLIRVSFALQNKERFKEGTSDDPLHSEEQKKNKKEEMQYLIDSIENSVNSIKKIFATKF